MTSQDKKLWLMRYKTLDLEIDRLLEEKSRWYAKATKITPSYSDTPVGCQGQNRIQFCIEQIEKLEHEINQKIDLLVKLKREIERSVLTVQDQTLRLVLYYRYIDGHNWEQIAKRMKYDVRHIYRLHGNALLALRCH